ncbi:MAG: thermonuclease family protein [Albidovulum sp.]|uniref:thermonuclease family protein n=1 Tax=Albidovulum sp. TaxID=1872424 RepID=UPI003C9B42F5
MARHKNNIVRFSRGYRRPPKWNMGLARRRNRIADPRFYLRAVIGFATFGLVALPGIADGALSILRPLKAESESCRIYQVVDGDTVRMWCPDSGNVSARLTGFDTPELFSPQCSTELAAALKAKWALRRVLWQADEVRIVRDGNDRYGRALVAAYIDDAPLARRMIADGHARAYGGGARQTWCA